MRVYACQLDGVKPNLQLLSLKMEWRSIFVRVTLAALVGMVLGGLFGFGAGTMTPAFFQRIIPLQEVEPIGAATFFGATIGVLLEGGPGCFAIVLEIFTQRGKPKS